MESPDQFLDLEVRRPDGRTEGPMDLARIREQLYAGLLRGDEELRRPDGEWMPMGAWPQLASMLELLGHRPARVRWKSGKAPAPVRAPQPVIQQRRHIAQEVPQARSPWPWLLAGLGIGGVLLALWAFYA